MTQSFGSPHSALRVFSACLLSALLIMMPFVQLAAAEKRGSRDISQASESGRQAPDASAQDKTAHNAATNLFLNAPIPRSVPEPPAIFAPTISATMTDAILNDDADSKADPNPPSTEKIEYTVTISNTGSTASSVVFNDTVDPHTTLVAGSVNASPLSHNDSFTAIGNTLLEVGVTASGSPAVVVSGSVFDNDTEFLGDTFTLKAVQAVNFVGGNTTATTANGGTVTMEPDGNFSYLPPVDSTTTDTFTYTITDDGPDNSLNTPDDLTSTSTVTITFPVTTKVWWVDNSYGGANGASDGRSTRPYTSLTPLNGGGDLDDPGDVIYVHTGSGNYTAGITMEANQQLIGNGVALVVNSITLRGIGARPSIVVGAGDAVSVPEIIGVVIRGLNLNGAVNAIDVTTTGANSGGVEIADNVITGAGQEGIDVNGGGSGTMTVSIHDNSVTATGNGIDVRRTAGSVNVTAFDDNIVLGTTGGIGINVVGTGATVLFDTNPGTPTFDTVAGGTTIVGAAGAGNGAGAGGMTLSNVRGDLSFTDLDLYADTGTAFLLLGTTPNFTTTSGTRVTANTNTPVLVGSAGAAADVTDANINLALNTLTSSSSSATRGVSLVRVSGTFTAITGSPAITSSHASGTGFFIDGGSNANANVNVTYSGTIFADIGRLVQIQNVTAASTHAFSGLISDNQDAGGADGGESGILLSANSGATISFTGGLNVNTTTNTAFSATGGGTITATQNNGSIVNTLSSVSNTALTVTSTNIGSTGMTFRSINAGNNTAAAEPVNGILLTSTGTAAGNGGLTVTGNSAGNCGGVSNPSSAPNTADCTGGTIQKASGTGVSLSSTKAPSFTRMYIFDNAGDGIKATTTSGFSVISSYMDSNADQTTPDESGLYLLEVFGTATITNSWISNSFETDLRIENSNITNGALTVNMSGCSVFNTGASSQAGNLFNFLSTLTSNMTLNLSNSRFDGNRVVGALTTDGIHADTSGGTAVVNVSSSTFVDNFVGISVTLGGSANSKTMDYDINGNTVTGSEGSAINVTAIAGKAGDTMEGKVRNNLIGTSGVMNSGSLLGFGMDIDNESIATYTAAITGNTVREIRRFDGINARQVVSAGTTNVTITGNTIDQIRNDFGSNVFGIVVSNTIAGGTTCGNISGNTLTNIDPSGFGNGKDLRVREAAGTLNITQATPTAAVNAAELDDANGIPGLVEVVGVPSFSQPACATVAMLNMQRRDHDVAVLQTTLDMQSLWGAAAKALRNVRSELPSVSEASTRLAKDATRFDSVTPASETRQGAGLRAHHASFDAKQARTTDEGSEQADVRSHHARVTKLGTRNSRLSAMAAPLSGEPVGPVNLGTLLNGDTVIIKFQVTVDNPPNLSLLNPPRVSTQGSVSYNDGATPQTPVLTDEVAGGAVTATETPVDLFDVSNTLASDLNPSNSGDLVTFTATIAETPAQASVNPTGTVDFIDTSNGNAVICNDVALTVGLTAQCQTSGLTAGTHNMQAVYSGDGNFETSTSNTVAQVVVACVSNPVVTKIADTDDGICDADCSLREAIGQVCSGTTITFDTAGVFATPQTITLTLGELSVGRNVTIDAPDSVTQHVTVSGGNVSRVFNVNSGKTVTMREMTITGGSVVGSGGGILNDHGALTLINMTISSNTATGAGGGIAVDGTTSGSASLTVSNSTISGNTSNVSGGGIYALGTGGAATVIVANSTISGNNADIHGGGLFVSATTATFTNVTVTNNRADNDNNGVGLGGGLAALTGTVTLHNTIVAGNLNEDGLSDARDDINGTIDSLSSFNLIGDGTGMTGISNGSNGNQVGTGVTPIDAGLNPLANNGGPTFTHALSPGSPAVEAGSNTAATTAGLTTDQRGTGFPRIADSADLNTTATVDIGAYELHPTIENIADQTTAEDTAKLVTFNLGDDTGALITGAGGSVTATSSNTALVASDGAHLSFTGSGGSRTLTVTPNTDANSPANGGTTTITITVTATNGQTAQDTFDLTVTEVNDTPDAVNDTLTAVDEDSGLRVIPFTDLTGNDTKGATNESSQTLNVTAVSNPVGGTVAINGTNVEFTVAANFSGTASFDYQITDNGTTNTVADPKSDTATASFAVNSINDPPSFVIAGNPPAVNEDAGAQTVNSFATSISQGAGGETGQTLTFNITPTGTTGNLSFSSGPAINSTTGALTYTTNADTNGTATFDVTLSDNGSNVPPNSNTSGTQSFTITVNAVNDAPTFQIPSNPPAVNEDAGLLTVPGFTTNFVPGPVTATDEGTQTLVGYTVTPTGTTGNLAFTSGPSIDNAGTLTYTPTANTNGTATFNVVATDSGSGSAPNVNQSAPIAFTITVNAVNDEPSFTAGSNQTVTISSGAQTVPGWATNIMAGPAGATDETGQVLTFNVSVSGTTNTLTFVTPPAVSSTGTLTYHATNGTSGTATVDIFLTDNGSGVAPNDNTSPTQTFTITVGQPTISVQDATVAEPASPNTTNMVFTVTLNAPAAPGGASVNFTTADEAAAPGKAVAGVCGSGGDYVLTSGTITFAVGEQVKSISVPVCSDGTVEPDETFLVNLSVPVNATINDGTATGTITAANTAGSILISEIRTSGPGGATDEFVEIYNNSNAPHTVAASDASAGYGVYRMGADCNATPILVGTIPNGTVMPARGHYLFTGSAYSLANYGGTNAALGDDNLAADIPNDANVAIFSTTDVSKLSSLTRYDAVGFGVNVGGNCDLLREGSNLPAVSGSVTEHSFFRKLCDFNGGCTTPGIPKDANNNATDFLFADTQGTNIPGIPRLLGAPGPENMTSPLKRDATIAVNLLDSTKPGSAVPNRARDLTSNPGNSSTFGTLAVRRRIFNNTGANVTRLRFRIVEMTTFQPTHPSLADLRALSSTNVVVSGVNDAATCGVAPTPCSVTVFGTTLEQPPTQTIGGGLNATLAAGTVTIGTPLAPGASVNVEFLLGIQQTGAFRFLIIVEALP